MGHLDENDVLELLEHWMPKARRAEVEAHLDGCPACLELLAVVAAASPARPGTEPTEPDVTRHLTAPCLAPGDRLAGRFVLDRVVGEGGMGVVWAARDDRAAGRPVALKLLKEVSAAEKRRLLREARLMRSFDHPGILDVKEVVEVGDEVLLVMDLLDGESLGARLGRVGRLSVGAALDVLVPLVEATMAAHARGVVHRDLKPENVFLHRDGRVLLLDFGMAKLVPSLDLTMSGWMTESGLVLGTPHYMAPEQVYGERDVDARADVWAIGVVAYECLSGERPVSGKSFGQIVRAMQRREIVALASRAPDVPAALADVVGRMLAHDRALRPPLEEVRAVLLGSASVASGPAEEADRLDE
ncbi:MAG: serine/threonine protein kinase [Labilithrix sp.]|nr:serine/threonine protein kinase [Labilithrix sp.]MCW5833717.1 serine/threonine protein kinase [Labilithrix sp.]